MPRTRFNPSRPGFVGVTTPYKPGGERLNEMSGTSKKTTVISIRLPNDVVFTLNRRINGRRGRWESVGEYLQERIIYDTMRVHARRDKP